MMPTMSLDSHSFRLSNLRGATSDHRMRPRWLPDSGSAVAWVVARDDRTAGAPALRVRYPAHTSQAVPAGFGRRARRYAAAAPSLTPGCRSAANRSSGAPDLGLTSSEIFPPPPPQGVRSPFRIETPADPTPYAQMQMLKGRDRPRLHVIGFGERRGTARPRRGERSDGSSAGGSRVGIVGVLCLALLEFGDDRLCKAA